MTRFMPKSPEAAAALEGDLANSLFKSPSYFVEIYNSGLISHKHDSVVEMLGRLTDTYLDVRVQGGSIVFISPAEVHVDALVSQLEMWSLLVKVKRELESLVASNELSADDVVLFSTDRPGLLLAPGENEGEVIRLSEARFASKKSVVDELSARFSSETARDDEADRHFRVFDLVNVDTDFIGQMASLLP